MKKKVIISIILFSSVSFNSFAATGYARGGLLFSLSIIGILLAITGIFCGIDHIKKNGKRYIHRTRTIVRTKLLSLWNHLKQNDSIIIVHHSPIN
jgi:hypothetical protein